MRSVETAHPQPEMDKRQHGIEEIPEGIKRLSPYEKIRELDVYYERLSDLEKLSEQELEQKIEAYQNLPEYHDYQSMYINFHDLENTANRFAGSEEGNEEKILADDLKNVVRDIKINVSNYYTAVMYFERTKINRDRLDEFAYKEAAMSADRRRKIAHDVLIDDVIQYTRLVNKVIPGKTDFQFHKYEMFNPDLILDLRSNNPDLHKPARERLATWAFLNERGIHVERAVEKAREVLEKKKAVRA